MVLHTVGAETPLEQIDDAATCKLAGLHLKQVIGKREQPEPGISKFAQSGRHLLVRWHRRELLLEFLLVCIVNFNSLRVRQHLHDGGADIRERNVTTGYGQGGGIHDEIGEPEAHGPFLAEDALKRWL